MAKHIPAKVPLVGNVISVILQMTTFAILSICLLRRVQNVSSWKTLPVATWLVVIIYAVSAVFVFLTSIIERGIGINESHGVCESGIIICLFFYMAAKVLIYCFLVEKAYVVRGSRKPRLRTKLWLFNTFGMLVPYCLVVVLNFIYRIAYINDKGVCIIGMKKISMMPLIIFDVLVNVYLTLLFILPLRGLYSYQHNTNKSLRTVAYRSFIGSCATLTSSVVNLTVLMVLIGEPGWICLMCCNADTLFAIVVLHWVTSIDRTSGNSSNRSNKGTTHGTTAVETRDPNTTISKSKRNSIHAWQDDNVVLKKSDKALGVITTEIRAMPQARQDSDEESFELQGIRVQTERRHEVQDMDMDSRRSVASANGSEGHYVAQQAEKMV